MAPHLHLPLQSGSDPVLRLMRRPYHTGMYRALVERLAAAVPDLGLRRRRDRRHPGETDADFEATIALVEACPSPTSTCSRIPTARARRPRGDPVTCRPR